ncbi:MAG: hypothetical protein DMG35_13630 [Acidobacteria bacterium]|nr:MAG: hypothetical protein AUH86_20695 [Acidobacteria bacterium 13_1_40CM_4_58_4]OLE57672.1 MAG: hypothetical protein AUG13_02810 [Chloroflexi bacterium 13_1_20CM_2_59_7]PYT59770.1 MAG: hypothetical protein DMG35_13630 [Acidobacteriota bacterium]
MNRHPYLRAYMAGIVAPTVFLLVVATAFAMMRYVFNVPVPIERVIVFPMAVVPNLWGLWNMLFVALRGRLHLSIGLHGALLPILLAPLGIVVASLLNFPIPNFAAHAFPIAAPVGLIVYYLAWKYVVSFFNRVLELA